LAFLSFIWLALCVASIWLILKNTQSVGLALLSVLAIFVLGGLAVTLIALFQKISVVDEQQRRLEDLPIGMASNPRLLEATSQPA
jgi:hypothetical protein